MKVLNTEQGRTGEETTIINPRLERIVGQRRVQNDQIKATLSVKLEDKAIVSPRPLKMKIYANVKISGIEDLFYQD